MERIIFDLLSQLFKVLSQSCYFVSGRKYKKTTIQDLPLEILEMIFEHLYDADDDLFLNYGDLDNAAGTCRRWLRPVCWVRARTYARQFGPEKNVVNVVTEWQFEKHRD